MNEKGYDLSGAGKLLSSPYISFWIYFILAVACATISWYCVEQPFNNLKKLFDYVIPKKKKENQQNSNKGLSEKTNGPE
jgi:peptidoglycan/LPS O-acetylase OafA/YrhL